MRDQTPNNIYGICMFLDWLAMVFVWGRFNSRGAERGLEPRHSWKLIPEILKTRDHPIRSLFFAWILTVFLFIGGAILGIILFSGQYPPPTPR